MENNFINKLQEKIKENKGIGFFSVNITKEKTETIAIGYLSDRQLCEVIIKLEYLSNYLKNDMFKAKDKNDFLSKEKE